MQCLERAPHLGLVAMMFTCLTLGLGCDRTSGKGSTDRARSGTTDTQASGAGSEGGETSSSAPAYDDIDLGQFDDSCSSDDECMLVSAGDHCGPCRPPCKLEAIATSDRDEFVSQREAIDCRAEDLERAENVACEPCPALRARCIDEHCKSCFRVGGDTNCN